MLLLLAAINMAGSAVVLTEEMQTFGGALKSFAVKASTEQTLYKFTSPPSKSGAPHTVTEQWFSLFGGAHQYDPNVDARIRIYLDNATAPVRAKPWCSYCSCCSCCS